ncbi:semaphorin-5A [Biomphalaria glabrata]|uniref:A disintegrin and metalloproteinase with thrombospondin motifs adt-1-like n=1 Tax=Biomphalaria glabrata TaxID=6526 RepID=A0A9U8EI27_BIOGL|nr:A disintegrin and metalloproteinase with thrombospondin motifs adt-1-like [Biomphalaria glabrata]KAI8769066.1 semaphorin-5A-like [Biomphalaria glabrata]KAI8789309.1 semaphorin-5A [Biomphalaria glabrata]
MTLLIWKPEARTYSFLLLVITFCAVVTWWQVNASAVLANSSLGEEFLTHLDLDQNYMKSMHKLLEEDTGLQEDQSRGFREPPLMDKGGMLLRFEDESTSWTDWAPAQSNIWTEWTDWTNCVQGYRRRSRSCRAAQCSGQRTESVSCDTSSSNSDRTFWSEWAGWSSCINGQQTRVRQCRSDNNDCNGEPTESRPCDRQMSWSNWETWTGCQNGQSGSTQTRQRNCLGGSSCDGFSRQSRPCSTQTETSIWSPWGTWSACDQGKRFRTRSCQGSSGCVGLAFETSSCLNPDDRQQWSSWSSWSTSSTWGSWSEWSNCNNGYQLRQRTCTSANQCSGSRQETKSCTGPATVPSTNVGYWGAWSSCNGGYQIRYFTCTSGPEQCGTTTSESRACNTDERVNTLPPTRSSWTQQTQRPQTTWVQWSSKSTQSRVRPSQAQWSSWSSWSEQNTNTRTRPSQQQWGSWSSQSEQNTDTRTRPSQQQRGSWSSQSEQNTDTRTRPSQQQWGSWSSWSAQGTDTRARLSQPQWGSWSSWSSCDQGLRRRVRTCITGQCNGNNSETLPCYLQVQPMPLDPGNDDQRDNISGQQRTNNQGDPRKGGHRDNNSGDLTYHKPIEWIHKKE